MQKFKENKNVLIADKVHPRLVEGLKEAGFIVDHLKNISRNEFVEILPKYHGVVINSKTPMYADQINKAKNLAFIARLGSGLDIIDLKLAEKKGIRVFSAPEGNRNAVAEHALGMLLSLSNNLCRANFQMKNGIWQREENRGFELEGKTIGVIGYGNNGSAFVDKLANWNTNILIFDKYKQHYADSIRYATETSLEEVKKKADVISLHIPLNEANTYFVDETFLANCKRNVILINTSRGKVVKTAALLEALDNNQLKGACLDVFENEKMTTYTSEEQKMYERLWKKENVIVSPHIAGWTKESLLKIAEVLLAKILNSNKNTD